MLIQEYVIAPFTLPCDNKLKQRDKKAKTT